jgi:hypothetical protein
MAGYVPLFETIATGTLYGRWPDIGLWPIVLALGDRHGVIDVTPQYLAGVTGLCVDDVTACMRRFCEPDPLSRSRNDSGARLKLIDAQRDWGWLIVNHAKYREKARKSAYDTARVESGADATRKRQQRAAMSAVPPCPEVSRAVPLSNANANANKDTRVPRSLSKRCTIPADFILTPAMEAQAISKFPDCDPREMFVQFRAYHAREGSTYARWPQAWTTWIGNAEQFGYPKKRSSTRKWQ